MESVDGLGSLLVVLEVDEAKALAAALIVNLDDSGSNGTELLEKLDEVLLGDVGIEVLDVDVGEIGANLLELRLTLLSFDRWSAYMHTFLTSDRKSDLLRDVVADVHLLVVQKHAVDGLDGSLGSLSGLVVDESVSLGAAMLVGSNLAGQDITEGGEGIVEGLLNRTDQHWQ